MTNFNDWNQAIIAEFRANGGKVGGQFAGAPLLLMTITGARTGTRRTTPVMYNTEDGQRLLVFASKAGAPTNPDWYHNLVANPEVTVEVGAETYTARATVLTGEERDRLFRWNAEQNPGFAEYEAKTTRTIPVVALDRVR